MVETEADLPKPNADKEANTNIDVTEIIEKVRGLVTNVREMAGKPMDVKVDSFNFAFNKASNGEYGLSVDTKIIIKPK